MSRSRGRRSRNPNGFNKPAVQKQIDQIIRVVGDEWAKEDIYRLLQETDFNTELVVDKVINGDAKPNPDSWHTVENKTKKHTVPTGGRGRGRSRGRGGGMRDHSRGAPDIRTQNPQRRRVTDQFSGGRARGAPRGLPKKDGPPGGRQYTPAERARLGLDAPTKKNGLHQQAGGATGRSAEKPVKPAPMEKKEEAVSPQGDGLLPTPAPVADAASSNAAPASGSGRKNPKRAAREQGLEAKASHEGVADSRPPHHLAQVWRPKPSPTDEVVVVESKPVEPVVEDTRETRPNPAEDRRKEAEPVRTENGRNGHKPIADILPSGLGATDELASVRLQFGNFGIATPAPSVAAAAGGSLSHGDGRAARRVDTKVKEESDRRMEKERARPAKAENGPGPRAAGGRGGKRDDTAHGPATTGGAGYELAESAQYLRDPSAMAPGFPPYVSPYMAPYGQYGFDDPNAGAHGVPPHSMFPYGDPSHGYPSAPGFRGAASPPFQREPYAGAGAGSGSDGSGSEETAAAAAAPKGRGDRGGEAPAGGRSSGGPAGGAHDGKSSPVPHSPHGYPGYGMGAGPMHPYYAYPPIGGGYAPYGPPSGSGSNPAYSRYPYQQHPYFPPKYGMSSGYGPASAHAGPYEDGSSAGGGSAGGGGGGGGGGGEYPMSGDSSFWPGQDSKSGEGAPSGGASAGPPTGGRGHGPAGGPGYGSHDRLAPYDDGQVDPSTAYSYGLPGYGGPPSAPFGASAYGMPPAHGAPSSNSGQFS